jgi:DNA-binding IclR family transcriptional regulator
LGKTLLADLPRDELDRYLAAFPPRAVSSKTQTDVYQIKEQLARVRAQGYAADDEETIPGVGCIAAPIRNHTGRVIAALNVSGPAAEFEGSARTSYVRGVGVAATAVSVRLGYPA